MQNYIKESTINVNYTPVCTRAEISMIKSAGVYLRPQTPAAARISGRRNSAGGESRPTTTMSTGRERAADAGDESKKSDIVKQSMPLVWPKMWRRQSVDSGDCASPAEKAELVKEVKKGLGRGRRRKRAGSVPRLIDTLRFVI